jgi:hypothetical protein
MKTKNRLILFRSNLYLIVLCFAIILSIPLQFLDVVLRGKNRILKKIENKIFTVLFTLTDLKRNKNEQ